MTHPQLSLQELRKVFQRRRKLFFLPIVIVTALCTIGAFILPQKFESSTTILVQRDEVLNPLVSFEMAVTMASEDMLKTFNEIIFSTSTVQAVIDTLHLAPAGIMTEEDRQELLKKVRKNIATERPGASTFTISYLDTDPLRAQKAVSLVSNIFIRTILQVENKRNEMAVDFFEVKLEELRQRFEHSQQEMLVDLRRHIQEMPGDKHLLSTNLEESERDIRDSDTRMKTNLHALTLLHKFQEPMMTSEGREAVYEIQRLDIPYAAELRTLIVKYDGFARKYTTRYPEMRNLVQQIHDLLIVMTTTLEKEVDKMRTDRLEAERRRAQTIDDLQRTSVSQREDEDKESSYDIYRKLYNEMKVKLEQARTTRDLGRQQKDRFMVIDPPLVPATPSKPNRVLIIGGGFGCSILIGFFSIAVAELLDTRMRHKQDFSVYQKPIIAYITDGSMRR